MPTINFRVSDKEKAQLEAAAQGNLSAFCREVMLNHFAVAGDFARLMERQTASDRQVTELIKRLSDRDDAGSEIEGPPIPLELISSVFETLYLLRLMTPRAQLDQAKSAIERLGLPYVYNKDIADLAAKSGRSAKGE